MSSSPESVRLQWSSGRLLAVSTLVAVSCALVLLATSPGLPMAWDEGNAIWRSQGIQRWAELLLAGNRDHEKLHPLSEAGIAEYWRYTTQIEGHPAFYGIVIAAGRSISRAWLGPLQSSRFGPILLFALAAGVLFFRLVREYSTAVGLAAVVALMLLPRVFAHVHFASFDGPLTSCWILAWAAFAPARDNWRGTLWPSLFGIALGMTLSCKATGWIAPVPFLAWALLHRDRAAARALALGTPIAAVTFFLLNPPLWHHPFQGWITFFGLNLSRGEFNISTQFLGRMYNLDHPLPWYNTLVWTGITVPTGILLLMGVGAVVVLRRWREDRAGTLLLLNGLVLLVVRALPWAPPHDGVRLFLPSFAFLAALAGVGAGALLTGKDEGWRRKDEGRGGRPPQSGRWFETSFILHPSSFILRPLVVAIYLGSASSLFWYAPQWLSYYNLAIGGLPGATAMGMEPTYYWDGLDRSVLDWLDRHTGPGEKVRFASAPTESLAIMQRWGTLPVGFRADAPGTYRWYVVQHRPSGMWPVDHWLVANCRPAFRKTIRAGGWGPWRLDVPLVEVYPYEQYLLACERSANDQQALPD
ncbi:MAG: glycosyltransferase 87 family protein [Planctomycetota bacterium]